MLFPSKTYLERDSLMDVWGIFESRVAAIQSAELIIGTTSKFNAAKNACKRHHGEELLWWRNSQCQKE